MIKLKDPRKIIQIATTLDNCGYRIITALCDDGSLWSILPASNNEWLKIKDIPQDKNVGKIPLKHRTEEL